MEKLRLKRKRITVEYEGNSAVYSHCLSFYLDPPLQNVELDEFEDHARGRIKLLHLIGHASLIGHETYSKKWKHWIMQELKQQKLDSYLTLIEADIDLTDKELQLCNMDNIAHHALKLAFCKNEELREWWLQREIEFFQLRLMCMCHCNFVKFLTLNNLGILKINDKDKAKLFQRISSSTSEDTLEDTLEKTNFYEIRFMLVLPLIQKRQVFIHKGFAYVPEYELRHYVTAIFAKILSNLLEVESKKSQGVKDRVKFNSILNIHQTISENIYNIKNSKFAGHVTFSNLNQFAKKYFPLCMRHIHETFTTNHHLKHETRLQYLFFLYGLGMSYVDIFEHWRHEFTKIMDEDTFRKKYVYSIRYAFGQVGRKKVCVPRSCEKIISDSAGCPFKSWDVNYLKTKLEEFCVDANEITEILEAKVAGYPQTACAKLLQCNWNVKSDIIHPNQYFEISYGVQVEATEEMMIVD